MEKKTTICLFKTKTDSREFINMVIPEMVLPFKEFKASNGVRILSANTIDISGSEIYLRGDKDAKTPDRSASCVYDARKYDNMTQALSELSDVRENTEIANYDVNTSKYIKDDTTLEFISVDLGPVFGLNNISIDKRLRGASAYTAANGVTIKSTAYPAFSANENRLMLCGTDKGKDGQWLFMPADKKETVLAALSEYSQRAGTRLSITDLTQTAKMAIINNTFTLKAILKVRDIL